MHHLRSGGGDAAYAAQGKEGNRLREGTGEEGASEGGDKLKAGEEARIREKRYSIMPDSDDETNPPAASSASVPNAAGTSSATADAAAGGSATTADASARSLAPRSYSLHMCHNLAYSEHPTRNSGGSDGDGDAVMELTGADMSEKPEKIEPL
ncbi:hypothetical protein C8R44DRAFT_754095 [Mycena epipterygia]|nr:hypothetical protein C8R44DRAFT_754095 [Mycena epipterygia]